MKRLLLLLSLLIFTQYTYAYSCGDTPLIQSEKDGVKYGVFISTEAILKTPEWQPSSQEPPISVSQAVNIAQSQGQTLFPKYDKIRVRAININPYHCLYGKSYWYYLFDMSLEIDGNELIGVGNWVAVLMDGTVIGTTKY